MTMAQLLQRTAGAAGGLPAVALGERVLLDYAGLASRAGRLAATLTGRLGLRRGDRVALAMKNCPEYLEVIFGLWWAGLAAVPMNAKLHPREFAYMLEHCGARLCFATRDVSAALGGVAGGLPDLAEIVEVGSPAYAALFSADPLATPLPAEREDLAVLLSSETAEVRLMASAWRDWSNEPR